MKNFFKSLLPPILLTLIQKFKKHKYGWFEDYKTWSEAKKASTGYDSELIVQVVRNSVLKVKNGEAVYERDSVIFNEIQYSWPLLAGLMFCSAKSHGTLKVCDFGGSLGSTYFQNKKFLDRLTNVSWSVVEQEHFVDIGKRDFQNQDLKFFHTVEECVNIEKPNVLLLSSVLQYIEKPYKLLDNILKNDFDYILIDRTPFSKRSEYLTLQIVPPNIYKASYPCWFFDEEKLIRYLNVRQFRLVESFIALDGENSEYIFKGIFFEKIKDV